MPDLTGTHTEGFTLNVEAFTSLTPGHFSKFNDRAQILLNNDTYLNGKVNELWAMFGNMDTRQNNTEQALANLTGRVGTLESSSGGGSMAQVFHDGTLTGDGTPGNPLGINPTTIPTSIVTTSSNDWVQDPQNANTWTTYVYPPVIAGAYFVPVAHTPTVDGLTVTTLSQATWGAHLTTGAHWGQGFSARITGRNTTPTMAAVVTWLVITTGGQAAPPTAVTSWEATSGGGNVQVNTNGTPSRPYQDFAITRPAAAPAGSTVRISGLVSGPTGSGGSGDVFIKIINGGTTTTVGRTPYTGAGMAQENNYSFDVTVPPAGNWTLRVEYTSTASDLGSDMDAGTNYSYTVTYLAP
ncbi:hypothetical protein [Deinococcus sp. 23YEL01]|uniref:hypothetical protein n=1 Tax=Deinococcus sp. 23YEL01 TaxID=2745871 RepID=UPI001E3B771B|nr:hypothetical protein [Deinococcus sp. 23YEL01]MCD0168009.1 hypothetical protein [Deinococcus sp. 23YEL01]